MKNKSLFVILVTILLSFSFFYSFRVFQSHQIMSFLMYDFNNDIYNVPDYVYSEFNDITPNLTSTALPLKMLKARYYANLDSLDIAKKMLFESIGDNPYIKAPEQILARIYIKEEKFDSALLFSRDAFLKMPNVNPHRDIYFQVLRHFKDSTSLDNAFDIIRNSNNTSNWYDYIYSKNIVNPSNKNKLYQLIEDFKSKFPNKDHSLINQLKYTIELGTEGYALFEVYTNAADEMFANEQYKESAEAYEEAIKLNSDKYLLFENAAIAYDLSNQIENAKNYYDKVINDFRTKDGRVEFYKGLMLIRNNDMKGCEYLEIASNKNHVEKNTDITAANVYIGLCLGGVDPNN